MIQKTILCKVEFVGSAYRGWQVQPNLRTIQGEIQKAFSKIFHIEKIADASSRTDAGVHAKALLFTYEIPADYSLYRLIHGVNHHLPEDIVIHDIVEVPNGYKIRKHARAKIYTYQIYYGPFRTVLDLERAWWVKGNLDWGLAEQALQDFIGTHDFTPLQGKFCTSRSPIKTIHSIDLKLETDGWGHKAHLTFYGSGFVKNQIRIMTGTMVDIAKGKTPPNAVKLALSGEKELKTKTSAPPEGLCLQKVFVEDDPFESRLLGTWNNERNYKKFPLTLQEREEKQKED